MLKLHSKSDKTAPISNPKRNRRNVDKKHPDIVVTVENPLSLLKLENSSASMSFASSLVSMKCQTLPPTNVYKYFINNFSEKIATEMYGKSKTWFIAWMNMILTAEKIDSIFKIVVVVDELNHESNFAFVMLIWLDAKYSCVADIRISAKSASRAKICRFWCICFFVFVLSFKLNACNPLTPICVSFEPKIFVFARFSARFKWRSQLPHKRYACSSFCLRKWDFFVRIFTFGTLDFDLPVLFDFLIEICFVLRFKWCQLLYFELLISIARWAEAIFCVHTTIYRSIQRPIQRRCCAHVAPFIQFSVSLSGNITVIITILETLWNVLFSYKFH